VLRDGIYKAIYAHVLFGGNYIIWMNAPSDAGGIRKHVTPSEALTLYADALYPPSGDTSIPQYVGGPGSGPYVVLEPMDYDALAPAGISIIPFHDMTFDVRF
jgi:hypothetical protein